MNNMSRVFILCLLLFVYYNCSNKCDENKELKIFFLATIDSLEEYVPSSVFDTVPLTPVKNLLLLTGIAPNLDVKYYSDYFSDSIIYPKENFDRDKKKWNKWYRKNKCLSMRQVDSIIAVNEKFYMKKLENEYPSLDKRRN